MRRLERPVHTLRNVTLARWGVTALIGLWPLLVLVLDIYYAVYGVDTDVVWVGVGVAALVPLHTMMAWEAVCGRRRTVRSRVLLCAITAVVIAVTPAGGLVWTQAYATVVFAAMIALVPWQATAVLGAAVALEYVMAAHFGFPPLKTGTFNAVGVLKAVVMVLLARLVVGAERLDAVRAELRRKAVVRERHRLSTEISQRLGGDLVAIRDVADRLAGESSVAVTAEGLQEVTALARATLANARRLTAGYRSPSLDAEIDTARALLTAAGLSVAIVGPSQPGADSPRLRADLRDCVAALLAAGSVAGPLRLLVSPEFDRVVAERDPDAAVRPR